MKTFINDGGWASAERYQKMRIILLAAFDKIIYYLSQIYFLAFSFLISIVINPVSFDT